MVTLMQNDYFNLGRVVAFLEKYQGKVKFELDYRGNYWHGTVSMQKKNGSFAVIFEAVDKQLSDMMDYIGQYCLEKMMTPPTWSEAQVHRRADWAGSERPLPPGIPPMHTEGALDRARDAMQQAGDAAIDSHIRSLEDKVTTTSRFEVHHPNLKQVARDMTMPSLDMPVGEPWPPANIELGGE